MAQLAKAPGLHIPLQQLPDQQAHHDVYIIFSIHCGATISASPLPCQILRQMHLQVRYRCSYSTQSI